MRQDFIVSPIFRLWIRGSAREILSDSKAELTKVDSVNIDDAVDSIRYIDSPDSFLSTVSIQLSVGVKESGIPSDEIEDLEDDLTSVVRKLERSLYAYEEKIIERRKELVLAIDDIESLLHAGEIAYASEVAKYFKKS